MRQADAVQRAIDWRDLASALVVGAFALPIKLLALSWPEWELSGPMATVPFLIILGYVLLRGRREPEKLDDWGLTTPLKPAAIGSAFALAIAAVAFLAGCAKYLGATLTLEPRHISQMINYIDDSFCQQFYMCSVGLVTLATFPVFKGAWSLPLFVGLVFSGAHFWTPHLITGTFIPVQMLITFPVGFAAAWYFLRFRSIIPLTLIQAMGYILLHNWVEVHL